MEQNESEATSFPETDCEELKFLYEKAIEGRNVHLQSFNHWMNMYAIFNGALFVGFYMLRSSVSRSNFLEFVVPLLGCVAGWFWHFSSRGFYDWVLSWIGVVSFYEQKLTDNRVYQLFIQTKSDDKNKKWQPFSTQKLTKRFTFFCALLWTGLLIWRFLKILNFDFNSPLHISFSLKQVVYIVLFLLAVVFILSVFEFPKCYFLKSCRESVLSKSHSIFYWHDSKFTEISKPTTEEKN